MPRLTRLQQESQRSIARLEQSRALPAKIADELLTVLSHAVPNDGQRLFGIDPATLLINRLLAASSNDDMARIEWLRDYYLVERAIPFMQFPTLMRTRLQVTSVHDSQERCWGIPTDMLHEIPQRDFYRSYHEGRTPVGGAIHMCLHADGRWIGALQMYRRDAHFPFRPSEVSFVHRMAPAISRALASAFAREHALSSNVGAPNGSGVLILDDRERIQYSSPAGEAWVDLLRQVDNPARGLLPSAVWSSIARLRAEPDVSAGGTLIAPTQAGPIRVEASWGGSDGTTVVVFSPERRAESPTIPIDWPLTPQERRVVELVICGLSNSEVAMRLFVGEKTIETHLGRIYEKLNLKSRHQLIAHFFKRIYLPELVKSVDAESDASVD